MKSSQIGVLLLILRVPFWQPVRTAAKKMQEQLFQGSLNQARRDQPERQNISMRDSDHSRHVGIL